MLHAFLICFVQSMLGAILAGFATGVTYRIKGHTPRLSTPTADTDEAPTPESATFVFCGFWGLFTGILLALQRSGLIGSGS